MDEHEQKGEEGTADRIAGESKRKKKRGVRLVRLRIFIFIFCFPF